MQGCLNILSIEGVCKGYEKGVLKECCEGILRGCVGSVPSRGVLPPVGVLAPDKLLLPVGVPTLELCRLLKRLCELLGAALSR